MTKQKFGLSLSLFAATLILTACGSQVVVNGPMAQAGLLAKSGSSVAGNVHFEQIRPATLRVTVSASGLRPDAAHGFHVHEKGDCSAADASSAGGHYNPRGYEHGKHDADYHHAGDMPNLVADANGNARATFEVTGMTIGLPLYDIIGRSVVIHRDADDYKTQPAGNSGPRIACGVIGKT